MNAFNSSLDQRQTSVDLKEKPKFGQSLAALHCFRHSRGKELLIGGRLQVADRA